MKGNIIESLQIGVQEFTDRKMRFEYRLYKRIDKSDSYLWDTDRGVLFGVHSNPDLTFENAQMIMRGAELLARSIYASPVVSLFLVSDDDTRFIGSQH